MLSQFGNTFFGNQAASVAPLMDPKAQNAPMSSRYIDDDAAENQNLIVDDDRSDNMQEMSEFENEDLPPNASNT